VAGCDQHRTAGAECGRGQQVIGAALREPGQHVGGSGRDQQQITPARELDMQLARYVAFEHGAVRSAPREAGKSGWSDELGATVREHDLELGAFLFQRAE